MDFTSIPLSRWTALVALTAATGLRSATPPAALALRKGALPGVAQAGFVVGAIGELAGDKHPSAPARTSPQGLAGRLLAGAAVGYFAAGKEAAIVGGLVAAAVGAGASKLRAKIGAAANLPDPVVAVGEDWIAIGLTALTVDAAIGR